MINSGNAQNTEQVQLKDALITYKNGLLTLENSLIKRDILLSGNLFATSELVNKKTGKKWVCMSDNDMQAVNCPALTFAHDDKFICQFKSSPKVGLHIEDSAAWEQPSLIAEVKIKQNDIELTRCYQIYPDAPVIVSWSVLSNYESTFPEEQKTFDPKARRVDVRKIKNNDIHDAIYTHEKHLKLRNIKYTACTDYNDNLVNEEERYSFSSEIPWYLDGNLLFAESLVDGEGMFFLKESPTLAEQPDLSGADFTYHFNTGLIGQIGWGFTTDDFREGMRDICSWRTVIGVYDNTPDADAEAVKSYLKSHCNPKPDRDWTITCNQWGDREMGKCFSEDFLHREIDACAEIGITSYMLDAGWETGNCLEVDKLFNDGSSPMYDHGFYWNVDKKVFPHGLKPIIEYAKSKGVELSLWFNPDSTDENKNAPKDMEVLNNLHSDYGVRIFKIDGVWNLTRKSFERNKKMLETLVKQSDGEITYHLDITNGMRWGYFTAHHLGQMFVENRYSHFGSYLPYRTHKNLWQLSKYLMPQKLLFEFLNNSEETGERYKAYYPEDDPYTAEKYSIDYCLATVLFGAPLAWFEPSKLNNEQVNKLKPLVAKYKEIKNDIFAGDIYPIGEKPSGSSITGFQSHNSQDCSGLVCVYREVTERSSAAMRLARIPSDKKLQFELIYGNGSVASEGNVYQFTLPERRSYALFKYKEKC